MHIRIGERLRARHTMLCDVMTEQVRPFLLQDGAQFPIADIQVIEACPPVNRLARSELEAIDHQDIVAGIQICAREMPADEPCAPGNRYLHGLCSSLLLTLNPTGCSG